MYVDTANANGAYLKLLENLDDIDVLWWDFMLLYQLN